MSNSWMPKETGLDALLNSDRIMNADAGIDMDDEELIKMLAKNVLLYNIPFKYLIPSEMYLKEDRISFFHLDTNWILALLDGALSLGRNIHVDYQLDQMVMDKAFDSAVKITNQIRPGLQGKELPAELNIASEFCCTGFVMRSPLVGGWRGLEFKAYDKNSIALTALRIETIRSDVLIGLYLGCIHSLEILEPPESLYYGFNAVGTEKTKVLRSLESGTLFDKPPNQKKINIKERGNRVIDFEKCGEDIKSALSIPQNTKSSHIALQMIQNAHKIKINPNL